MKHTLSATHHSASLPFGFSPCFKFLSPHFTQTSLITATPVVLLVQRHDAQLCFSACGCSVTHAEWKPVRRQWGRWKPENQSCSFSNAATPCSTAPICQTHQDQHYAHSPKVQKVMKSLLRVYTKDAWSELCTRPSWIRTDPSLW